MVQINKDMYFLAHSLESNLNKSGEKISISLFLENSTSYIGSTVDGYIKDSFNIPISEAVVKLTDSNYNTILSTITDKNGFFSFPNVIPRKSYILLAYYMGKNIQNTNVFSLSPGENKTIILNMQPSFFNPSSCIVGYLEDSRSSLSTSGIAVYLYKNNSSRDFIKASFTNGLGFFFFDSLNIGSYLLDIYNKNFNLSSSYITDITNYQEIKKVNIVLSSIQNPPRNFISGILIVNGSPLNRANVFLYDNSGKVISSTKTSPDGLYLFYNIHPGEYVVKFNDEVILTRYI